MLTIAGSANRFCDGMTRRNFLKIGGLAMGGMSMADIFRAEAEAGVGKSKKAIIMVFLSGGPPHQDMFDLKMDAPVEIRGEFQPIHTKVPGIDICELFPRMAGMADKLAFIRSIVGSEGRHAAFQCMTGWPVTQQPQGGWPCVGSAISKLLGPTNRTSPAFVNLSPRMKGGGWSDPGQPGFLGMAHAPFKPSTEAKQDMVLNGVTLDRFDNRQLLLASFDRFRRDADASGVMDGLDAANQQAFGVLTSHSLGEALDYTREPKSVRERYGYGAPDNAGYGDAGPLFHEYLLTARRLVETGVRCVTLAYGRWDWHGRPHGTNFENARDHFPALDQSVTALVEDLHERGMSDDVSVVVWGEFGRTPRINPNGGRDHWPQVSCGVLAGGGMRTGQVIGSTNRLGEHAVDRPVHFQEVFATLYHRLGIDVNTATVNDLNGRPMYLVDHVQPMRELI